MLNLGELSMKKFYQIGARLIKILNVFRQVYIVRPDAFVSLFCGCDCFGWVDVVFVM